MAEVTYYWTARNMDWDTHPEYMVDGILANYTSTSSDGDIERITTNTCLGTDLGTISKVEIRCYGYGDGDDRIDIKPIFGGTSPGDSHQTTPASSPGWGTYVDITNDNNAPSPWTWSDVQALYAYITKENVSKGNIMYCAKVEIRVTYEPTAGWTNIAKVNAVGQADIAKVSGVAVADIAKISGVAV